MFLAGLLLTFVGAIALLDISVPSRVKNIKAWMEKKSK